MSKRFSVLIALLMLGFFVAGCADGDKSATVVNPNPDVFSPVGSISGTVYDACTEVPIKGAVVAVAYNGRVHTVTTASNGAYSFSNVPANGYGGYSVSCDLTKVTAYGYAIVKNVYVGYSDLDDGNNSDLSDADGTTESGSGANTPVTNLASIQDFTPGPLTSGISGKIFDVTTGLPLTAGTGTAATVALYDDGNFVKSVPSTDGTYSFTGLWPSDTYQLLVTKADYVYAALQASNTIGSPNSCNLVDVTCDIGCGQLKESVNVYMIKNAAKDKTVPYIARVDIMKGAVVSEQDIIDGDVFPTMAPADITSLVATFSEGMQASRSLKGNAVNLTSEFNLIVTVTTGGAEIPLADQNIIKSYTVTMTSAGVMTITPTLKATADWVAAAGLAEGTLITFAYDGPGTFTATLTPNNAHLTDLSFNSWSIGNPGALDAYGFLHSFGEAYQDYFILGGTAPLPANASYNIAITVGE